RARSSRATLAAQRALQAAKAGARRRSGWLRFAKMSAGPAAPQKRFRSLGFLTGRGLRPIGAAVYVMTDQSVIFGDGMVDDLTSAGRRRARRAGTGIGAG